MTMLIEHLNQRVPGEFLLCPCGGAAKIEEVRSDSVIALSPCPPQILITIVVVEISSGYDLQFPCFGKCRKAELKDPSFN
jgi:hypothetical protein